MIGSKIQLELLGILCLLWLYFLLQSYWITQEERRHELRGWWGLIGAMLVPLTIAGISAWREWSLFGLSPALLAMLIALPSLVAVGVHGRGLVKVLTAKALHRSATASYYIARDGVQVNSDRIKDCDVASFRVIAAPYARDRSKVFYYEHEVVGADPETFSILELEGGSRLHGGRDRNRIYLENWSVPELSPQRTTWKARTPSDDDALAFDRGAAYLILSGVGVIAVPGADSSLHFVEPDAAADPERAPQAERDVDYLLGKRRGYLLDARRAYYYAYYEELERYEVRHVHADPRTFRWLGGTAKVLAKRRFDAQDAQSRFMGGQLVLP